MQGLGCLCRLEGLVDSVIIGLIGIDIAARWPPDRRHHPAVGVFLDPDRHGVTGIFAHANFSICAHLHLALPKDVRAHFFVPRLRM